MYATNRPSPLTEAHWLWPLPLFVADAAAWLTSVFVPVSQLPDGLRHVAVNVLCGGVILTIYNVVMTLFA